MRKNTTFHERQKLPHEIPAWVQQGARHYITINCRQRGVNILNRKDVFQPISDSARFYDKIGRWYLWLMVVMPDHIHFIAIFDLESGIRNTVRAWKSYQTKTLGIKRQSDFFEHRLRNDAEFIEKAHYIRMNPVRRGLVTNSEEWPYILDRMNQDGRLGGTPRPT